MKRMAVFALVGGAGLALSLPVLSTAAKGKPAAKAQGDGRESCYTCHDEIKALKEGSKHARLACSACHDNLQKHMESSGDVKPVTMIDQALCGKCHQDEFLSFNKVDYEAQARKE
ncbi:MAG TPA: ammonia-forming cytochrome c nitrite reductase subunit c552, partial [Geobacteraceae bacterium]|nr:ammonia-forming cytochrome c nitrite reductase subunit c552 [Geobacteraceae bacterium]